MSYKTIEVLLHDPFKQCEWVIIDSDDQPLQALLPTSDLAKHMHILTNTETSINLMDIPAKRLNLSPISIQANLQQAHEKLMQEAESLYVVFNEEQAENSNRIYGILTKEMVEAAASFID